MGYKQYPTSQYVVTEFSVGYFALQLTCYKECPQFNHLQGPMIHQRDSSEIKCSSDFRCPNWAPGQLGINYVKLQSQRLAVWHYYWHLLVPQSLNNAIKNLKRGYLNLVPCSRSLTTLALCSLQHTIMKLSEKQPRIQNIFTLQKAIQTNWLVLSLKYYFSYKTPGTMLVDFYHTNKHCHVHNLLCS